MCTDFNRWSGGELAAQVSETVLHLVAVKCSNFKLCRSYDLVWSRFI